VNQPSKLISIVFLSAAALTAQVQGVHAALYVGTGDDIAAVTDVATNSLALITGAKSLDDCDGTDDAGPTTALCVYQSGWVALMTPSFGSGPTNIAGMVDDVAPGEPAGTGAFIWYVDGTSGFPCVHLNGASEPACMPMLAPSTPSASTDACTPDAIWHGGDYLYVCVASGDIRRTAVATW
jgi:hypothetical protein